MLCYVLCLSCLVIGIMKILQHQFITIFVCQKIVPPHQTFVSQNVVPLTRLLFFKKLCHLSRLLFVKNIVTPHQTFVFKNIVPPHQTFVCQKIAPPHQTFVAIYHVQLLIVRCNRGTVVAHGHIWGIGGSKINAHYQDETKLIN